MQVLKEQVGNQPQPASNTHTWSSHDRGREGGRQRATADGRTLLSPWWVGVTLSWRRRRRPRRPAAKRPTSTAAAARPPPRRTAPCLPRTLASSHRGSSCCSWRCTHGRTTGPASQEHGGRLAASEGQSASDDAGVVAGWCFLRHGVGMPDQKAVAFVGRACETYKPGADVKTTLVKLSQKVRGGGPSQPASERWFLDGRPPHLPAGLPACCLESERERA